MAEREISIVLKAKNLTSADFQKARAEILGLGNDVEKADKQTTSFGDRFKSMTATLAVGSVAAAGALTAVVAGVIKLGQEGAEVADIRSSFDTLNKTIGNSPAVLDTIRAAFKRTVSDVDIMKATNLSLSQGLKLTESQFELTARASRVLADRVGGDTKTAYETLLQAMATGQDRTLKQIGLDIDAEAAVKAHAAALGVQTSELTEAETETAKRNAILAAMQEALRVSGDAELDFADRVDQARTMLVNIRDEVSEGIAQSPVLASALGTIADAFETTYGGQQRTLVQGIVGAIEGVATASITAADVGLSAADSLARGFFFLRGVTFQVLGSVLSLEAGLASMAAATSEFFAKLPGATDGMRQQALAAREHATASRAMADSLKGTSEEAFRAAEGQNSFSQTIGSVRQGLSAMQAAMQKAKASQAEASSTSTEHARSTRGAADAVTALGVASDTAGSTHVPRLTKSKKEAQNAADDLQKSIVALNRENLSLYELIQRGVFGKFETELKDTVSLVSMSTAEAGKARAEMEQWAITNGAVLAPSIRAVGTALSETGEQSVGFRAAMSSAFAELPNVIMRAIQGGGDVVSAAGSHLGVSLVESFTKKYGPLIESALPFGIGKAVTAMLPTIGTLLGPLASKISGFLGNIFGRPSDAEKEARTRVAEFEAQLRSTLTETQRLEAGNEGWKMTVIAVRDAYLKAGLSSEQAEAAVKQLWESSKKGGNATAEAIAAINAVLQRVGGETVGFANRVRDAIDDIPREIEIEVNGKYNAPDIDGGSAGYSVGTKGRHGSYFVNFGQGTDTRLHGYEAVITPRQAPDFVAAYLRNQGPIAAPSSSPNVHVLVEMTADGRVTNQRVISAQEFLRRQMQSLLRNGMVTVPTTSVGTA